MMNKKFDIFGSIWITSKLKPVFTYFNWKRSSNLNMNEEKKNEKFASFVPKLTLFEWESSLNGFVLKSLFFHFPNTKAHVLKYLQKFIECSNKDSTPLNAMHRPFNWLHFLMRSKNPATKKFTPDTTFWSKAQNEKRFNRCIWNICAPHSVEIAKNHWLDWMAEEQNHWQYRTNCSASCIESGERMITLGCYETWIIISESMSIQWDANDDIFSFASANVLPMNRHSYQERNKHQQIMAKQQQNECDEKKWEQTHSDEKSRNNFQCKRECEWANANDCRLTNVNEKCCNIIQTLCAECVTKTTRNHITFVITAKCLSVILPFANVERCLVSPKNWK